MFEETPVRRICNRVADTIVLSLLVVVASVPLLTGFAALSAAAAVLDETDERPVVGRFLRALFRSGGTSLTVQVAVLAAASASVVDLAFAANGSGSPLLQAAVGSTGLLLGLAVVTVPVFAAALGPGAPRSWRRPLLDGAALAVGRPVASLLLLSLDALALAAAWVAPGLTPVLLGLTAVCGLHVARRTSCSTSRTVTLRSLSPTSRN